MKEILVAVICAFGISFGHITAYLETGNPTASGAWPTKGYTVACEEASMEVVLFPVIAVCEDKIGHSSDLDLYVGTEKGWAIEWGRRIFPILKLSLNLK